MSNRWPRSIRWRLQLWLAFLLACVLAGFGFAVYQLQRVNHLRQIDDGLEVRVAALSRALRDAPFARPAPPATPAAQTSVPEPGGFRRRPPPGPPPGAPPAGVRKVRPAPPPQKPTDLALTPETAGLFEGSDYYFAVWYRDGALLKHSPGTPADLPAPARSERDTLIHWRTRQAFREAFHCSGLADCALAGRSIEADSQTMRNFAWSLLGAGGAVLALGLGVGWWLTTRAIRPIEQISAAASRISEGHLSERIEAADRDDELGRLAAVLNSTFTRLEAVFARQRQFTADAAHELRTPLAVIISETQTALSRDRTAAEYRESVETCLDTAQEMRRLTQSLLELSRVDEGDKGVLHAAFDLAETARSGIEKLRPLAAKHGVRIEGECRPASAFGSTERVAQVITNLLTNAIHYNRAEGGIRITTGTDGAAAVLTVADTGIGIPAADLAHVFERFYRVDRARSRAAGHTGLGLAICKALVDAERGTIEIASELDRGTTVTVRLPMADPTG